VLNKNNLYEATSRSNDPEGFVKYQFQDNNQYFRQNNFSPKKKVPDLNKNKFQNNPIQKNDPKVDDNNNNNN